MRTFYLGTHMPGWLSWLGVPLFVSDVRLRAYRTLPRAAARWALDSGGFSELQKHGRWTVTPVEYIHRIERYHRMIGKLDWAAPQDWMCEPIVINGGRVGPLVFAGTKLSVHEHQRRTIANWLELDGLARARRSMPRIIKVIQGYEVGDYLRHIDMYRSHGIDLRDEPLVGVGSVCRRQNMDEACAILDAINGAGIRNIHAFGFKAIGLRRNHRKIETADSQAWSLDARYVEPLDECRGGGHKNCANCPRYALRWRTRLLASLKTERIAV